MNIYEKLLNLQQGLKAPKGQKNDFGKYNYRSCEDILTALKPLLAKENCVIVLKDELHNIGERYYVKATAVLIDVESGEEICNTAFAREEETKKGMDGSQITGASSSYARKYALNGLFGIDDTKDSDATNKGDENSQEEAEKKDVKNELKKFLLVLCDGDESRVPKALEYYTKFKGKDGNEVAGVTDINKLSDKRLQTTYGKVKVEYLKKLQEV